MSFNDLTQLPSLKEKLELGGYQSLEEIQQTGILELTKELQLSTEEVELVIKICNKEPSIQKRTLAEIIATEEQSSISTSSKSLDLLLGHGVPPFKITELCGESGSGKTQLCMQLAVNVQLAKEEGGVDGECLYIDTEGSFQASRFISIARRLHHHSIEKTLKGIHVFRVLDHAELIAIIRQLPEIIQQYPKIKLVIIDSIAYHFRMNVLDARARTAILIYIARMLIEMAKVYTLSVVVTNHVVPEGQNGPLTPSLGQDWGYWCTNRLFLFRRRHYRFGYLYKAVENENSRPVQFRIKDDGISDPDDGEFEEVKKESEVEAELNKQMDTAWEQLKQAKVKQEKEGKEFEHLRDDNSAPSTKLLSQAMEELDSAVQMRGNAICAGDEGKEGAVVPEERSAVSSQMIAEGVASFFEETSSSSLSEPSSDTRGTATVDTKRKIDKQDAEQDSCKRLKRSYSHISDQLPAAVSNGEERDDAATAASSSKEATDAKSYWDSDLEEEEEEWDRNFFTNIESYL